MLVLRKAVTRRSHVSFEHVVAYVFLVLSEPLGAEQVASSSSGRVWLAPVVCPHFDKLGAFRNQFCDLFLVHACVLLLWLILRV